MRAGKVMRRFLKQLELLFDVDLEGGTRSPSALVINGSEAASSLTSVRAGLALAERSIHLTGRDYALESQARELLRQLRADKLAREIRVQWNSRLKSCAGRADYREKLISLNPQLRVHPEEIDRTFRHELAHLLAQFRAGRRRILPHGPEWQAACRDLGIGGEKRCHNLPFPTRERARRFLYKCPNCRRDFPRVRRILRAVACLACCRAYNRGKFDSRFRLKLISFS